MFRSIFRIDGGMVKKKTIHSYSTINCLGVDLDTLESHRVINENNTLSTVAL